MRIVEVTRPVGLADVRPDGTMRLDALARVVQDVADADASSAVVDGMGVWIVRRLALDIVKTPRFRSDVIARTRCTGVGPRWAERTTTLSVGEQHCVDAVALWVHTDPGTGAATPLPAGFDAVWGEGARENRVSARLSHPLVPDGAEWRSWVLRATDLDVVDHVNNAAYWAAVEDELRRRDRAVVTQASIEFRTGLDEGDDVRLAVAGHGDHGFAMWFVVGEEVRASVLVACRP